MEVNLRVSFISLHGRIWYRLFAEYVKSSYRYNTNHKQQTFPKVINKLRQSVFIICTKILFSKGLLQDSI